MAFIDYGTLIFKNEKQINTEHFMPIGEIGVQNETAIDKSGWNEDGYVEQMDGNYFGFAGDEEFYIAAYKNIIRFVHNGIIEKYFHGVQFNKDDYEVQYSEHEFKIPHGNIRLIRRKYGQRLYVEMNYKNDIWFIITGYGIDVDRNVFNEVWADYGVDIEERDIIRDLWKKSDAIS